MKKVSVIIPAYNMEKHIVQCLDSICSQTYENIEIIVVNDGSVDDTEAMVKEYALRDSRIKLFSNENHGVSYSRNFGIKNSEGYYIAFLDADDLVDKDFIEILVDNIEKSGADISVVGLSKESEFSSHCFSQGSVEEFNDGKVLEGVFGAFEGYLWNKLYIKDMLIEHNIMMDEGIGMCEDLLFNLQLLMHCKKAVYYSGKKYFYRQVSTSAQYRLDNKNWFSVFDAYEKVLKLLEGYDVMYNLSLFANKMNYIEARYRLRYVKGLDPQIKNLIKKESRLLSVISGPFSIKQRVKLLVFRLFPSATMYYRRRKLR